MKQIIIALAMVLMVATAAWGYEDYLYLPYTYPDNVISIEPEDYNGGSTLEPYSGQGSKADIMQILTECLEFVPDGSDIKYDPPSCYLPAIYKPPMPVIEPGAITKAQAELDRLKRQTELNHRIKAILKILKGGNQ